MQAYFLSADGKTIYFRSADERGPGLFTVTIEGKDRRRISDGPFQGLTPTHDRRKVFYTQNQDIYQMELTGQRRKTQVTFAFSVKVDQRAEWAQILDESWRVMKYRFYDEKMHGRDWNAIRAKYEPLLKYVGENEDVYDLANEMIGELNASHTGVSGPPSRVIEDAYQTRYPGFELEPSNGCYRVSHIYRDGPADKEWLDLKVGDYVARDRRHADQGRRQLLGAAQQPAERVRHRSTAAAAPTGAPVRDAADRARSPSLNEHQVRGVGREEPRDRRQGDERPDRLRPHPRR